MAKKKTTHVKNMEQLEEALENQELNDRVEVVEESSDFQMSAEAMSKFKRSIRDSHQIVYRNMLENVDRMIFDVVAKLRRCEDATEELADVEDAMYDLEEFSRRQRYTMPLANVAYVDRDYKLYLLAEINLLVRSGRYPIGADGKARSLTSAQQAVLWH